MKRHVYVDAVWRGTGREPVCTWIPPSMTNFLLGTVAGGIIACVATIAAARHPDIQYRLGLIAPAQAAPPPAVVAKTCPSERTQVSLAPASSTDKLFERRRFWFVAP